ncbi:MAG TPA: hypothetical protein VL832_30120 [Puia sp.]|nr:hypothetical protein [Puia sp.]
MAEFTDIRSDLLSKRQATEQGRLDLLAADQRLRALQQQRAALERQKGDNNPSYLQRSRELDQQIAAATRTKTALQQAQQGLAGNLRETEGQFAEFADPRRQLAAFFSNETPFLLFPLRMETRFKTVNGKAQLWVRVYPDECLVDSFEPLLSRQEVNNAARFWAAFYGAGQPADPANPDAATLALQKAAWSLLVGIHGEGRSSWITRQLQPDVAHSVLPLSADKRVILTISTSSWDVSQQAPIFDLFLQLWVAGGDSRQVQQIKADFNTANPGLDADNIIATYQPVNFSDKPPAGVSRADTDLVMAVVVFPDLDSKIGKEHGWSQPTRVNLLPERLALIRYKNDVAMEPIFGQPIPSPLPTSPDPSASSEGGDPNAQFQQTPQGDLVFADSVRWVSDFDRAVALGMGFRVDLAPDEVNGFQRLAVLGVRLSADAETGGGQLGELFDHHYFSKKGFSLLPQGTPTNNTGSSDSGYTSLDNADGSYEKYFLQKKGYTYTGDPNQRADGQWFAEWLGLDDAVADKLMYSDGKDQQDVRNMNTALWPATMGYVLESMMKGGIPTAVIAQTRDFFSAYVSGRGPVPAVRIGKQPYGILPTAAFRRLTWMNTDNQHPGLVFSGGLTFLSGLYRLLLKIDDEWTVLRGSVKHIGSTDTDVYQTLLDIVGLNACSVEFYRRYLESLEEVTNSMSFFRPGIKSNPALRANVLNLLRSLGYPADNIPQLVDLLALPGPSPIAYLIDDQPLAEDKLIRSYTADQRNYIAALIAQARQSENALRTGDGLTERPEAELYRLLKYALELGYHNSGVNAAEAAGAFSTTQLATMRLEKPFIHQTWEGAVPESRYALLYETVPAISPTKTVSEFVRDSLLSPVVPEPSRYLALQLTALEALKDAPTARLERALVEHTDCCSYRLDAWKTGLLTSQLTMMRGNGSNTDKDPRKKGIYLGAYGWLENVAPERNKAIRVKELPQEVAADFNPDGTKVFLSDPTNEGYIHAPSLNQAVTAAILRNGYLSHGQPDNNSVLAINLTSERVRLALSIIEGIQGGQSLAALLGYQFERELHDRSDLTAQKIDSFVYALRKLFPLSSDQLKDTQVKNNTDPSVDPQTVPITAIEARNVVHGQRLAAYVKAQTGSNRNYPFALPLPAASPAVGQAIGEAVQHIIDMADAVADLGMAESVHHALMGNMDRAAGVLDSYSKGNYPQEPDVIRTPRSGITLTHRVAIPFTYVALAAGGNPRAQGEPSMNAWLRAILPPLDNIVCSCFYTSRTSGPDQPLEVSLQDLGLEPIDLLYMANTRDASALDELDDRLIRYIHAHTDTRLDSVILLNYTDEPAAATDLSLFQVMPLLSSLRTLLVASRALVPADLALANEADSKDTPVPELPAQRVQNLLNSLQAAVTTASSGTGILLYLSGLPDPATATQAMRDGIVAKVDDTLDQFAGFLLLLGGYGIPQTGIGSLYAQRQQWFTSLLDLVKAFIQRWQKNSGDYTALLTANPLPDATVLQQLDRLIRATPEPADTITLPIVQGHKLAFDGALQALNLAVAGNQPTLFALIQAIQAVDTRPFDVTPLDISQIPSQIVAAAYDLQARAAALVDDLTKKRFPAVSQVLTTLPTLSPADQAAQLQVAVKQLLGDAFTMIPRYVLPVPQQTEVGNSWNATDALLGYLLANGHPHPTEDWLHGIARVHDKMKHLENCLLLRQAFELPEDSLGMHPVQLPFQDSAYHWMALPYPEAEVDLEVSNVLLYTAFTASAAAAPTDVCGVLADEWNELIPAREETTGVSFHYDRPNSEAPQALLLVTPTRLTGNWDWNDLVDALGTTLDAAKARGVEPGQVDTTAFAGLLPAIVAAESLFPYSIVLDNKAHYMTVDAIKKITTNP